MFHLFMMKHFHPYDQTYEILPLLNNNEVSINASVRHLKIYESQFA